MRTIGTNTEVTESSRKGTSSNSAVIILIGTSMTKETFGSSRGCMLILPPPRIPSPKKAPGKNMTDVFTLLKNGTSWNGGIMVRKSLGSKGGGRGLDGG